MYLFRDLIGSLDWYVSFVIGQSYYLSFGFTELKIYHAPSSYTVTIGLLCFGLYDVIHLKEKRHVGETIDNQI